jgi:hypothetical protein
LLELVKNKLSADTKKYFHYGSTSQDVLDTAQVLMFDEAIGLIEPGINSLMQHLEKLIDSYGGRSVYGADPRTTCNSNYIRDKSKCLAYNLCNDSCNDYQN